GKCKGVTITIQGVPITVDVYILPLEGYDALLGAQLFRTLGTIVWNFADMRMKFQLRDKIIELKGVYSSPEKIVDDMDMNKEHNKKKKGFYYNCILLYCSLRKGTHLVLMVIINHNSSYQISKMCLLNQSRCCNTPHSEPGSLPIRERCVTQN
ncbi:hypothetical protein CFOL_v3_12102, partial [Cephalotus follicularis]